jgi:hypothetical protein
MDYPLSSLQGLAQGICIGDTGICAGAQLGCYQVLRERSEKEELVDSRMVFLAVELPKRKCEL